MMTPNEVQDYLRRRLIADLHLGRLKPGDRAPSLRIVAAELAVGIRAVSRAYAQLEREGLVRIRGRSGVYVAPQAGIEPRLTEPQAWYAEILTDAWKRRIPLPQLPELLQQFVSRRLRSTCIESTEDHMVAFCAELDEDFGIETVSVKVEQEGQTTEEEMSRIAEAVAETDFVVTTAFHASEVRAVAQEHQKPVVVVSVNEALVQGIQSKLRERPVVMVASDRRFVDRVERYLVGAFAEHGRMRVAQIDSVLQDPAMLEDATPMFTRAALRQVAAPEYHLLAEPIPFLSLGAAREITQSMIAVQGIPSLQPA
jgi:DNA-binding transcriptional regulator YhcF (GntR family)